MALSLEVLSLVDYIRRTGIPHRVTSTTGDTHSPGSYHYRPGTNGQGLAIDLAEPTPSVLSPGLLRIFDVFAPVEGDLAELIYTGAPYNIKDGQRVDRYAVNSHKDHVHIAVPKGTVFLPQGGVVDMTKLIAAFPYEAGYVIVAEDGAVYCFGCTYKGGLRWDGAKWVLR